MDPGTIVLVITAIVVIWLVVDLLFAGGAMTGGMMSGMAGMMGSGLGPIVLLLLVIIALLVYGLFFR